MLQWHAHLLRVRRLSKARLSWLSIAWLSIRWLSEASGHGNTATTDCTTTIAALTVFTEEASLIWWLVMIHTRVVAEPSAITLKTPLSTTGDATHCVHSTSAYCTAAATPTTVLAEEALLVWIFVVRHCGIMRKPLAIALEAPLSTEANTTHSIDAGAFDGTATMTPSTLCAEETSLEVGFVVWHGGIMEKAFAVTFEASLGTKVDS